MNRINPVHGIYPVNNVQPVKGNVNVSGIRNASGSDASLNESSLYGGQKLDLPQLLGGKLVPSGDRLATLQGLFDEKTLKQVGIVECTTCATRTYQDKSDDPSVSFQAPTRLSPEQAATAVISHEMEHVANEQMDAKNEGKEVIAQSVQIFHSICPECGKSYVSGGLTKTTTASESNPYKDVMMNKAAGNLVDMML